MGVKLYGGASTGDLGKVGDAISAYGTAVQGEADVIADIRAQRTFRYGLLSTLQEQLKTANNPVLAAGLVASSARLRELQDRALFYLYQRLQAAK